MPCEPRGEARALLHGMQAAPLKWLMEPMAILHLGANRFGKLVFNIVCSHFPFPVLPGKFVLLRPCAPCLLAR